MHLFLPFYLTIIIFHESGFTYNTPLDALIHFDMMHDYISLWIKKRVSSDTPLLAFKLCAQQGWRLPRQHHTNMFQAERWKQIRHATWILSQLDTSVYR